MLDRDFDLDIPTGDELLAEIGLDPRSVRDVIEDDRAMRCLDRDAVHAGHRNEVRGGLS